MGNVRVKVDIISHRSSYFVAVLSDRTFLQNSMSLDDLYTNVQPVEFAVQPNSSGTQAPNKT